MKGIEENQLLRMRRMIRRLRSGIDFLESELDNIDRRSYNGKMREPYKNTKFTVRR